MSALFDINDDGADRGYQASAGETLRFRLRQQPPRVGTVLYQVFDPAGSIAALGIAANPPRASKGAPALTLEGASSGAAVSPETVGGEVTVTLPSEPGHSWIVRCIVDGGMRRLPNGTRVLDPRLIHERGVWIPTALGARKVVVTERDQFEPDGWAGALADMAEIGGAPGPEGPEGPVGPEGPAGTVAVDLTLADLGGGVIGRAPIGGVIEIPSGSNDSRVKAASQTSGAVTVGLPELVHSWFLHEGNAPLSASIFAPIAFHARLVRAWVYLVNNMDGTTLRLNRQRGGSEAMLWGAQIGVNNGLYDGSYSAPNFLEIGDFLTLELTATPGEPVFAEGWIALLLQRLDAPEVFPRPQLIGL